MCRLVWALLPGWSGWDITQSLRQVAEEEGPDCLRAAFDLCDKLLHSQPYITRAFYGSRLDRLKLITLHGATEPLLQILVHVSDALNCSCVRRCTRARARVCGCVCVCVCVCVVK